MLPPPNPSLSSLASRLAPMIAVSAMLASGCAHGSSTGDGASTSSHSSSATNPPSPGIYAVDSGEVLDEEELFERLAEYRCVVVGESHGTGWHHELQADVLRSFHEERGRIALGMEMFQRPFQSVLDDYVRGEIDESTMLEQTEYRSRWGVSPEHYRSLWTYARHRDLPLIALNARAELTRKIARVGLEGLSEEARARLPETIDTTHRAHREFVRRAFGRHGESMSTSQFEHFYQAQVVWDETMAHRAATVLSGERDVEGMIVVTGKVHAHRDFGIPPRIERRLGNDEDAVATLMPIASDGSGPWSGTSLEQLREANAADFIRVRGPRP